MVFKPRRYRFRNYGALAAHILGGLNKASVSYAPGTYTMADANLLFPSPH